MSTVLNINNLAEIRKNNLKHDLEKMINTSSTSNGEKIFPAVNQHIINIVCYNRISFLHYKFNFGSFHILPVYVEMSIKVFNPQEVQDACDNPAIIHYFGNPKPWSCLTGPYFDSWWETAKSSTYASYVNNKYESLRASKSDLVGFIKERTQGRRLFLYGLGVMCDLLVDAFGKLGIIIDGVCDSYRKGVYSQTGHDILTPDELYNQHADATVLISSVINNEEIMEYLFKLNFPKEQIIAFPGKEILYLAHKAT